LLLKIGSVFFVGFEVFYRGWTGDLDTPEEEREIRGLTDQFEGSDIRPRPRLPFRGSRTAGDKPETVSSLNICQPPSGPTLFRNKALQENLWVKI